VDAWDKIPDRYSEISYLWCNVHTAMGSTQPSMQQLMTTFKMRFYFVMITVIIINNYNTMPIIYCKPTFSKVQYCTFGDKKLGGH
jgi:hypothetical protein